ncbi:uncharacterized protein LOC144159708 [Haemaphysalis longicornis]
MLSWLNSFCKLGRLDIVQVIVGLYHRAAESQVVDGLRERHLLASSGSRLAAVVGWSVAVQPVPVHGPGPVPGAAPPGDAHGRAAVPLPRVPGALHGQAERHHPPAAAHGRAAIRVPGVPRTLCPPTGTGQPRARLLLLGQRGGCAWLSGWGPVPGGGRFQCEVCHYVTASRWHLKRHQMVHTGEKPFRCHLCPMSFALKHNMATHMRTHTGERPFRCEACPRTFTQLQGLKKHALTHCAFRP